jgi:hypothetical protein
VAVAVFVAAWLVYRPGTVSQSYNGSDPRLIVPTSVSLLYEHDLKLGEYEAEMHLPFHGRLLIHGRPYNNYPIGASLLILPLVWLAGPPDPGVAPLAHAMPIAGEVAKVVAALSVALLFLLLSELTQGVGLALALSLVFAFATPHYPIHAGGLWTHNVAMPLTIGAVLLLVVRDGRHAWAASIPLALAFVTRPTTTPVIALLTAYVASHRPKALPRYLTIGLVAAVLFAGWSRYMYGTLLPPYYLGFHVPWRPRMQVNGTQLPALVGNLVSPNRGLFVFAPVLAFSLWGMVRAFRSGDRHGALLRTLSLVVVTHWVMISSIARSWWAGWSYGPRNFMDVLPSLVVLLVPAVEGFTRLPHARQAVVATAAAVAIAWSLFAAVHGATAEEPHQWNAYPVPVQERPERLWDWGDLQILRGTRWQ